MPSGRRVLPRTHGVSIGAVKDKVKDGINGNADDASPMASLVVHPKHAHIPEIPSESNLTFEALLFVFSVVSMCMQYISIYKTVWWLPHSHEIYALNFYLINPYLVIFLTLLMSRRVVWCFVKEVFGSKSHNTFNYWIVETVKVCVIACVTGLLLWSGYHTIMAHKLLYSLYLCCPLATYLILFGVSMRPLYDKSMVWPTQVSEKPQSPRHKTKDPVISHVCTMSPELIREEVEFFKNDFNNRIKQVLFNSMLCAYYMGFIPVCFAQNTLYYDVWWVTQHICLMWLCAFLMFMIHFLPPKYIDMLHRCALHLGRWQKVEGRNAHVPYHAWSELQVFHQGVVVKHVKGLFKAEGINNSASPANGMHTRFYFMFHQPVRLLNWMLILTWALIGYQFFMIVQFTEWSHVLSLAFLLFATYYVLFKLMRDRMILARAYKEEEEHPTGQS
ncbi:unnamed protein product [Owenia fusiformis]|uniref:Uncharacterized protein n=1 Tax=Owenia fusiformis TaxID=6347 RepID=A0A8J1XGU6_OWEFU|nr:unnamed protein product [Owenia fusiformis]